MKTQYNFSPIWLVKMKQLNDIQSGKNMEKKQTLLRSISWWEYELVETLERAIWQ